jgi:hypothetical protein
MGLSTPQKKGNGRKNGTAKLEAMAKMEGMAIKKKEWQNKNDLPKERQRPK